MKIKINHPNIMNWPFIYTFIYSVANVSAVFDTYSKFKNPNQSKEIRPIEEVLNAAIPISVNGALYKTFKKYYCVLWDEDEGIHTIVYGKKGWAFMRQDVNLTLVYPSKDTKWDEEDIVITGFKIILFMDGTESKAYVRAGGLLQEHITLSFICNRITTLSYEFWLYGRKRSRMPPREPVNIC